MGVYRKKPVEIEATDKHRAYRRCYQPVDGWVESYVGSTKPACDFADDEPRPAQGVTIDPATGFLCIWTLEGLMQAKPGDWIIRGVQDEFYPCKPDIFAATYELVEDGDPR